MLLKLQHGQDRSCCVSHPAEVCVFYCDRMHQWEASGKKLVFYQSLSTQTHTVRRDAQRHHPLFQWRNWDIFIVRGSVRGCLTVGPSYRYCCANGRVAWLPMSWNGTSFLFRGPACLPPAACADAGRRAGGGPRRCVLRFWFGAQMFFKVRF